MKNKTLLFIFLMLCITVTHAQKLEVLTTGCKTSFRGLSVVTDKIVWASGSNGTIAKSTDGGNTWKFWLVRDYEQRDFRDIEAFDSNTAIIMAVAEPAVILKTKDGGKSWHEVFKNNTKGMFLDAMCFIDNQDHKKGIRFENIQLMTTQTNKNKIDHLGVVIGDPIKGKTFIAFTEDDGDSWIITGLNDSTYKKVRPATGEAFFAASGSNIKFFDFDNFKNSLFIVSGGTKSHLLDMYNYTKDSLPIIQGKESTGANSIDINNKTKKGVIVGGDFANDKDTTNNCVLVDFNKEQKFYQPQTPPHGYRSCVIYINEKQLVTCGTSGIDISNDGGNNWQLISSESFHVVQKAKNGTSVFLAGAKGRIAKLIL